jgi:hypothetical protein
MGGLGGEHDAVNRAAMISANAAGPPQWHAAPPLTAWTSMRATMGARGAGISEAHFFALRIFDGERVFRSRGRGRGELCLQLQRGERRCFQRFDGGGIGSQ